MGKGGLDILNILEASGISVVDGQGMMLVLVVDGGGGQLWGSWSSRLSSVKWA